MGFRNIIIKWNFPLFFLWEGVVNEIIVKITISDEVYYNETFVNTSLWNPLNGCTLLIYAYIHVHSLPWFSAILSVSLFSSQDKLALYMHKSFKSFRFVYIISGNTESMLTYFCWLIHYISF